MTVKEKISALVDLGKYLSTSLQSDALDGVIKRAIAKNPWFTEENIKSALLSIANDFLDQRVLEHVVEKYVIKGIQSKRVGLVLAGTSMGGSGRFP